MRKPEAAPIALAPLVSYLDEQTDPKIVMDRSYRIIAANQAYRRLFAGGAEVVGRRCFAVSHHFEVPCDEAGESCPLRQAAESDTPQRVLHLHHTPNGEEHVDVEIAPVHDAAGAVFAYVETVRIVRHASPKLASAHMVGRAQPFTDMLALVMRVADAEATVLIQGETGTGKELVAHAIHEHSQRVRGPFVAVDCSGLTETLFESELFGYEKGAFTGAHHRRIGLVESASGGTLFLDEIGEVPLAQQAKLLRLIESSTFRRVGGVETLRADFRLVAATHRDLRAMVARGEFREDLYYRLNVFPIRVPPLRERSEDLPLLVDALLARIAPHRALRLDARAMAALRGHPFAGNIRELRNVLERAALLADRESIGAELLALEAHPAPGPGSVAGGVAGSVGGAGAALLGPTQDARDAAWRDAAASTESRRALARRLGVSERTLYRRLRQARDAQDD